MLKAELRKIYLARRKLLSAREKRAKSEAISNLFFRNFDLSEARFLHGFLPIEKFNEIDTRLIFEKIWRDFPQLETLAPRVDFRDGRNRESEIFARRPNWRQIAGNIH